MASHISGKRKFEDGEFPEQQKVCLGDPTHSFPTHRPPAHPDQFAQLEAKMQKISKLKEMVASMAAKVTQAVADVLEPDETKRPFSELDTMLNKALDTITNRLSPHIIVVEDTRIRVSFTLLSTYSQVLRKMLEDSDESDEELPLPLNKEAFIACYNYLSTKDPKYIFELNNETFYNLLSVLDFLNIYTHILNTHVLSSLKSRCSDITIKIDNANLFLMSKKSVSEQTVQLLKHHYVSSRVKEADFTKYIDKDLLELSSDSFGFLQKLKITFPFSLSDNEWDLIKKHPTNCILQLIFDPGQDKRRVPNFEGMRCHVEICYQDVNFSNALFPIIKKIPKLWGFTASNVNAVEFTKNIALFKDLHKLDISTPNKDLVFETIGELTNLRHLTLAVHELRDASCVHLEKLIHLEHLKINCTQISYNRLLHVISNFHKLRVLDLHEVSTSSEFQPNMHASLKNLVDLETLILPGHPIGDELFTHIQDMKKLKTLKIKDRYSRSTLITDQGVKLLGQNNPMIENLDLNSINISSLEEFVALENLRVLNVAASDICNVSEEVTGFKNLESLDISLCDKLKDQDLLMIGLISSLKLLRISTRQFSDSTIDTLKERRPDLMIRFGRPQHVGVPRI